eukprot:scaffold20325_cov130-Isochrysis_galbana.AAC.12
MADSGRGSRRAPRWGGGKRRRQGRWPVRRDAERRSGPKDVASGRVRARPFPRGDATTGGPHDNPPSLAGEGDPIPTAQKQAYFPSTWRRGKEGTRRRGKEPTPRVPREVDYRAGAFPHPFRGREESC